MIILNNYKTINNDINNSTTTINDKSSDEKSKLKTNYGCYQACKCQERHKTKTKGPDVTWDGCSGPLPTEAPANPA